VKKVLSKNSQFVSSKRSAQNFEWINLLVGVGDDGKYTIVDCIWVKKNDPDKWKSTPPPERDESEVVKWRVGKNRRTASTKASMPK